MWPLSTQISECATRAAENGTGPRATGRERETRDGRHGDSENGRQGAEKGRHGDAEKGSTDAERGDTGTREGETLVRGARTGSPRGAALPLPSECYGFPARSNNKFRGYALEGRRSLKSSGMGRKGKAFPQGRARAASRVPSPRPVSQCPRVPCPCPRSRFPCPASPRPASQCPLPASRVPASSVPRPRSPRPLLPSPHPFPISAQ